MQRGIWLVMAACLGLGCGPAHTFQPNAEGFKDPRHGGLKRASFDMDCPEAQIQLIDLDPNTVGASGCGKKGVYKWTHSGWVNNSATPEQPAAKLARHRAVSRWHQARSHDHERAVVRDDPRRLHRTGRSQPWFAAFSFLPRHWPRIHPTSPRYARPVRPSLLLVCLAACGPSPAPPVLASSEVVPVTSPATTAPSAASATSHPATATPVQSAVAMTTGQPATSAAATGPGDSWPEPKPPANECAWSPRKLCVPASTTAGQGLPAPFAGCLDRIAAQTYALHVQAGRFSAAATREARASSPSACCYIEFVTSACD